MCDDGYGIFYKVNTDRYVSAQRERSVSVTLTTTAFKGTNSRLKEFGQNLDWSLHFLTRFFPKLKSNL